MFLPGLVWEPRSWFVISSVLTPFTLFWVTKYFLCYGSAKGWTHVTSGMTNGWQLDFSCHVVRSTMNIYDDNGVNNRLDRTAQSQSLNPIKNSVASWISELRSATIVQNQWRTYLPSPSRIEKNTTSCHARICRKHAQEVCGYNSF